MASPIEEIKARLDIVELIQSYVRLQKAGINYKANCPFHSEKTPSFFISPTRQIWHCFGCGKGGDHFKFVMEIEGHDFPEALRLLAQRTGGVLKREDPSIRSERNRLYDVCEAATNIFERSLTLTPSAKAYLKKRELQDQTIQDFRIGFAPQSWDFLLKALSAKGFKKEEVEKTGLAIKSEDNASWYDRFRSRIMFPIMDGSGRVVGFSGRIFEPEAGSQKPEATRIEAKYVNTPNTLIYDKSHALYGFDKAKQEIRTKNQVVVVEGQMDCVMSNQAGIKNTIAVSGTALTHHHLKTLRRLCDVMVSSFDADAAGDSATRKSLALAAEFEFERKIALIPSGKDPAEAILENPKFWREAVEKARPVVEFYFEKMFRENDAQSVPGKKVISATLLPLLREISNEIERSHWMGELARHLGVGEEVILKELKKTSHAGVSTAPLSMREESVPSSRSRRELLEERLLSLLAITDRSLQDKVFTGAHHLVFNSLVNEQLFKLFYSEGTALTADLKERVELLRFKGEVLAQITKDIHGELSACKSELEKECIREQLLKLGEEIKQKEKVGNHAAVTSLLSDFKSLSETLHTFSS